MTIKYICTIQARRDVRDEYQITTVTISSEYAIPNNRLRRMVIDKVDKSFISFGTLTIQIERV